MRPTRKEPGARSAPPPLVAHAAMPLLAGHPHPRAPARCPAALPPAPPPGTRRHPPHVAAGVRCVAVKAQHGAGGRHHVGAPRQPDGARQHRVDEACGWRVGAGVQGVRPLGSWRGRAGGGCEGRDCLEGRALQAPQRRAAAAAPHLPRRHPSPHAPTPTRPRPGRPTRIAPRGGVVGQPVVGVGHVEAGSGGVGGLRLGAALRKRLPALVVAGGGLRRGRGSTAGAGDTGGSRAWGLRGRRAESQAAAAGLAGRLAGWSAGLPRCHPPAPRALGVPAPAGLFPAARCRRPSPRPHAAQRALPMTCT